MAVTKKVILHVATRNPETPWWLHVNGEEQFVKSAIITVPVWTRCDGHTPCANWYLEMEAESVYVQDGHAFIS